MNSVEIIQKRSDVMTFLILGVVWVIIFILWAWFVEWRLKIIKNLLKLQPALFKIRDKDLYELISIVEELNLRMDALEHDAHP